MQACKRYPLVFSFPQSHTVGLAALKYALTTWFWKGSDVYKKESLKWAASWQTRHAIVHETHGMSRNLFKGYILTLISICILPIVLIHYSTLHTFVGCGLVLPFSDAVSCNTSYFDFFYFFFYQVGFQTSQCPLPVVTVRSTQLPHCSSLLPYCHWQPLSSSFRTLKTCWSFSKCGMPPSNPCRGKLKGCLGSKVGTLHRNTLVFQLTERDLWGGHTPAPILTRCLTVTPKSAVVIFRSLQRISGCVLKSRPESQTQDELQLTTTQITLCTSIILLRFSNWANLRRCR